MDVQVYGVKGIVVEKASQRQSNDKSAWPRPSALVVAVGCQSEAGSAVACFWVSSAPSKVSGPSPGATQSTSMPISSLL